MLSRLDGSPDGRSRMAIALLLSLALHGLVLTWQMAGGDRAVPRTETLQVTLVNSRSETAPLSPQVLAQHALEGGGQTPSALAATPLPKTTDEPLATLSLEALQRRQAELETLQQQLLTQLEAPQRAPEAHPQAPAHEPQPRAGSDDADQPGAILNARIAALRARIEQYNDLPRKTFVAPAAQQADFAQYVEAWRRRIELIGTRHYPPEARGRVYGDLQVTVYIRRDGRLDHLVFDRPSSHTILNSAARRIVELASPFEPLPPALARDTDLLAITRTWHFTRAGLDTRQP